MNDYGLFDPRSPETHPTRIALSPFGWAMETASPAAERETGQSCRKDRCDPGYLRWVQAALNRSLGLRLSVDGVAGPRTRSAIRAFQQKRGLAADSTVGPKTEQALVTAGGGPPPPLKDMPCGEADARDLIPLLEKYRGDIPLSFLMGWVEIESGRRIDSITNLCERGYFQIHPDESRSHGIDDHQRLSYDPDYSVKSGIKVVRRMVDKTEALAKANGFAKDEDVFWGVVKLHHWIPSGPKAILDFMRQRGVRPGSWEAVKRFVSANKGFRVAGFDPAKGVENADKTLKAAEAWRKKLGLGVVPKPQPKPKAPARPAPGQPASDNAPVLEKSETAPPAQTLYLAIRLGAEGPAKPMTGVFIPQRFDARNEVDVIVYLHGIKPVPNLTIDRYWDKRHYPDWPLREVLNDSGKNPILVAPTLGPRSQDQTGWLTKPGGLDRYLAQVLAGLAAYGPYRNARPKLGNIILACHSGGGMPMRELALARNDCAPKIRECWGFDCTYFDADPTGWPRWAKSRPNARLYLYYRPGTATRQRAQQIEAQKIPNIVVLTSSAGHNQVPIRHWRERLLGASFLAQTRRA